MSLTPPPSPPLRSDTPADFITKAEAYLSWQQTFVTEIDGAIAIANVTLWISGTTYAVGNVVWSPTDYRSYRRIIAGAGTTDPVSDTTNWQVVPLQESGSKYPCRVATTGAFSLGAPGATMDGVTMVAGDKFLNKDTTPASANGIYIWNGAAVPVSRATDADSAGDLFGGMLVAVSEGTANGNSLWMLTTDDPITIGTTALTFARKDAGAVVAPAQIQPITASVAANALTITLNPTTLDFRSATLGDGAVTTIAVPSAISLVVPNTATLGTTSGQLSRLVVLAINNAGTVELAVANVAYGASLDESGVINTTTIAGGSNLFGIYSTTGRTGVAYRVVGFVESTQATAGTWATAPSLIQGIGGQALAALSSIGYGQTWTSVTRTSGSTYYNTTGKPIMLKVDGLGTANTNASVTLTVNGGGAGIMAAGATGTGQPAFAGSAIIQAGASYLLTDSNVSSRNSYELR